MASTRLQRQGPRQRVKDKLTGWIREQGLRHGDRIISQVELAKMVGAAEVTVHKALTELAAEGVVHRRKGVGTFVGPDRQAVARAVKQMCLVLPEAHLTEPGVNPAFWPHVQTLVRAFMEAAGSDWTFSTRSVPPEADGEALAAQLGGYDAVFFHHDRPPIRLMQRLVDHGAAPVIKLGLPLAEVACLSVDHDREASTEMGVSHLLERGYRRIGLLAAEQHWGDWTITGYERAHRALGLAVDAQRVTRVAHSRRRAAQQAGRRLLGESESPACDAIFVDSDRGALGVLDHLAERGLRAPEDVAVMGYDGVDALTEGPPHLCTVKIPYRRMIAAALRRAEAATDRRLPREHLSFVGHVLPGATVASRQAAGASSSS